MAFRSGKVKRTKQGVNYGVSNAHISRGKWDNDKDNAIRASVQFALNHCCSAIVLRKRFSDCGIRVRRACIATQLERIAKKLPREINVVVVNVTIARSKFHRDFVVLYNFLLSFRLRDSSRMTKTSRSLIFQSESSSIRSNFCEIHSQRSTT